MGLAARLLTAAALVTAVLVAPAAAAPGRDGGQGSVTRSPDLVTASHLLPVPAGAAEAPAAIDPGHVRLAVASDPYLNPTRIQLATASDGGRHWSAAANLLAAAPATWVAELEAVFVVRAGPPLPAVAIAPLGSDLAREGTARPTSPPHHRRGPGPVGLAGAAVAVVALFAIPALGAHRRRSRRRP